MGENRPDNRTDDETKWNQRSTQGSRPNEVGTGNELHQNDSRGNRVERTDIQLKEENKPKEIQAEGKSPSAFSISPQKLDSALLCTIDTLEMKLEIYEQFQHNFPEQEIIDFIQQQIGNSFHSLGNEKGIIQTNRNDGILIQFVNPSQIMLLTWEDMTLEIQAMIRSNQFLSADEYLLYTQKKQDEEQSLKPIPETTEEKEHSLNSIIETTTEKEKQYQLQFNFVDNGIIVWNSLEEENSNTLAHISNDGMISYYEKNLPQTVIEQIEQQAKTQEIYNKSFPFFIKQALLDNAYTYAFKNLNQPEKAKELLKSAIVAILNKCQTKEIQNEIPLDFLNLYLKNSEFQEKLIDDIFKQTFEEISTLEKSLKKKKSLTLPEQNYKKLNQLFPDICNQKYLYMELQADGFMPLHIEWIGKNLITMSHTYTQNGDLMYDTEITYHINNEKHTLEPLTYSLSSLNLYQDVYPEPGMYVPKLQKNLNSFTSTWLNNIKEQGYMPKRAKLEKEDTNIEILFDEKGNPILQQEQSPVQEQNISNNLEENTSTPIDLQEQQPIPPPPEQVIVVGEEIKLDGKNFIVDEIDEKYGEVRLKYFFENNQIPPIFQQVPLDYVISQLNKEKNSLTTKDENINNSIILPETIQNTDKNTLPHEAVQSTQDSMILSEMIQDTDDSTLPPRAVQSTQDSMILSEMIQDTDDSTLPPRAILTNIAKDV